MRLDESCAPVFARHETFHPRWGWIKKAFDGASQSPRVFTADDATLQLGVGKNMVRAIRFWAHSAKALTHIDDPERVRTPLSVPSRIGTALFAESGWDPYTEDPGTLWLLHWLLLAPRSDLPVWWSAFCEFGAVEFTDEQLTDFVSDQIGAVSSWHQPHPSSVAKDVSCLLRTYATSADSGRTQAFDDIVDCPLRELGLLRCLDPSGRVYRFTVGPKATLPPEIMLYASLDFLARTDAHAHTVTVSRLASEAGAPGRAFKVTETDLVDLLEAAAGQADTVRLARPAGIAQVGFDGTPAAAATAVIRAYFARRGLGAGPSDDGLYAGQDADVAAPTETGLGASPTKLPLEASLGRRTSSLATVKRKRARGSA
jgi:hypothetical protein